MAEFIKAHKAFSLYTLLVLLVLFVAVFAPWLAPQDPFEGEMSMVLQPPSAEHLLGTDKLGRDTFSRLIYGTSTSLFMTICLVFLTAGVGAAVGITSGYFGGRV